MMFLISNSDCSAGTISSRYRVFSRGAIFSSVVAEVSKRRPDGSTYPSTRSVRVSRKTGKEI
jgi:hypothetical protein